MTLAKWRAYYQLGLINIARVIGYRLLAKSGFFAKRYPVQSIAAQNIFAGAELSYGLDLPANQHQTPWLAGKLWLFSHQEIDRENSKQPPDWHYSYLSQQAVKNPDLHWSQYNHFDPELGDIKAVWELSRFDWLLALVAQAITTKDAEWLDQADHWLEDWCRCNPANQGVNWSCGQETAIRLFRLLIVFHWLQLTDKPNEYRQQLIRAHGQRIRATLSYAIAQDNNHATSEAAALYMAGGWLLSLNPKDSEAKHWLTLGRRLLQRAVKRLIDPRDGCFSQYSVTYHRFMLDTLSLAEWYRQLLDLPSFDDIFYQRMDKARYWLQGMIADPERGGDCPNFGSNDGAMMLPLGGVGYRDFRPSVQLASVLSRQQRAYEGTGHNQYLQWLAIRDDYPLALREETDLTANGLAIVANETARVYLRAPRYRFRAGQADAGHIDLWVNNQNVLRDGGTYLYNLPADQQRQFTSNLGHNTVEFDQRDQMLAISRFLYGAHPKIDQFIQTKDSARLGYTDYQGAGHHRSIDLTPQQMVITDTVTNYQSQAIVRFRLYPADWQLTKEQLICRYDAISLRFHSQQIHDLRLVHYPESLYYASQALIPVIEVVLAAPQACLTTTITWSTS